MLQKSLIFQRHLLTPEGTPLTIHYYLLTSQSFQHPHPVYGIRVLSFSEKNFSANSHLEEILHLSYSKTYTLALLKLCFQYLVTPTDLYCSVDTLMNQVS